MKEVLSCYGKEKYEKILKEGEMLSNQINEFLNISVINTVGAHDIKVQNMLISIITNNLKNINTTLNENIPKVTLAEIQYEKDRGTVYSTRLPIKDVVNANVPVGTLVQFTHIEGDSEDPIVHWGAIDDKYFGLVHFHGNYGQPIFSIEMSMDNE